MNRARSVIFTVLLGTLAVWGLWQVLRPLLPLLISGLFLTFIFGWIFQRSRW